MMVVMMTIEVLVVMMMRMVMASVRHDKHGSTEQGTFKFQTLIQLSDGIQNLKHLAIRHTFKI